MDETKKRYCLSIDQSTQGTKALIFDEAGRLISRLDILHKQIVNELGWVSHDGEEIYKNVLKLVQMVVEQARIHKEEIACLGISNQRETSIIWDLENGKPMADAVVWQCSRGKSITARLEGSDMEKAVFERTGIPLSPYFPAAKLAWLLENNKKAIEMQQAGRLGLGTMDTYLVNRLTNGKSYLTDFSNASRTQLFHIFDLCWDREICSAFGINPEWLPQVVDSNSEFGFTDFEGYLETPIPILGVIGDSHGALFGQGCHSFGKVKVTYGTGSSIMMNIGEKPVISRNGLVTSLAWGIDGKVNYVLEGNLNYTGAVITWIKDKLNLVDHASDTERLACLANQEDSTYVVPAFTGLGAPYWVSGAQAAILGMTRLTGREEIVKAALECIAYQITDVVKAMEEDSKQKMNEIYVDGGPTKNKYLMQFQSDLLGIPVVLPESEELSGIGAAYLGGLKAGIYREESLFLNRHTSSYSPKTDAGRMELKYAGWKKAVKRLLFSL